MERNKYRIPHILRTVREEDLKSGVVAEKAEESNEAEEPPVCDVCGYGCFCPPLRFEGEPFNEAAEESEVDARTRRARAHPVVSWTRCIEEYLQKEQNRTQSCFKDGNRGVFWRCLCCGSTVHEQCFDFADHWFWYEKEGTKCSGWCGAVTNRLRVPALSPRGPDYLLRLLHVLLFL